MSIYILAGARTPQGSFLGPLSNVSAPELGAIAIKAALEKAKVDKSVVDEVFMGNVVQAGIGQAPARQAMLKAGLAETVPSTTINKVCGSGLKAIITGAQAIQADTAQVVVAGGMESMSNAPFLLPQMRNGNKFGQGVLRDALQWDGLWDVYSDRPMGNCAEECVTKYKISREEQDQFAIESFKRAQKAIKEKIFESEIAPVTIAGKKGPTVISEDDGPGKADFEKIPALKPVFEKTGTITAANASSINDGASAVILAGEKYKSQAEFKIVSYSSAATNPTWFTTAPIDAIKKCLDKAGLSMGQIDLVEINEAFAVVPIAAMKELNIPHEKVNIFGGGISLGHPIGSSGSRIMVTLMNAMKRKNARFGLAAVCIGGGEALAMVIEKIK